MLYLQMVSAERVMDYCTLEPEASLETHPDSDKPPPNWPERGHIELADVTYRHSAKGPLVLEYYTTMREWAFQLSNIHTYYPLITLCAAWCLQCVKDRQWLESLPIPLTLYRVVSMWLYTMLVTFEI